MSYPDPPPPPLPFMRSPFPGGNVGGFWPQLPMNNEYPDLHSQFEHPPPFKRSRNSEDNPPNVAPFPPTIPSVNLSNPPVNRRTTHIFYKTRMCVKFLEGDCRNGDNCTFAHGADDLREPPPNWPELVKDRGYGNWNDDQRIIYRMRICKKFYNGEECPYGEKCNFLHESPAKFKTDLAMEVAVTRPRESSVLSIRTMGPNTEYRSGCNESELNKQLNSSSDTFRVNLNADSDVSRANMNASSDACRANMKPGHWKTKICSKWEATGRCIFGEKCHFAHGLSELQVPGGRVEAEVMMNTGSIAEKLLNVPVTNVYPDIPLAGAPTKEGEAKKGFLKWKAQKKINRIYGDWIDDLSPPQSLRSTVES